MRIGSKGPTPRLIATTIFDLSTLIVIEDKRRHIFTGETMKGEAKNNQSSVIRLEGMEEEMLLEGNGISVKLRSSLPRDEILIYISIPVAFG